MSETELDSILMAFWNPTRRRIIKRLSQEPNYPSRLSKELGIGQALVAKHLEALEDVGVATSSMETSPYGPKRREYLLSKSVSVTVDFAPHFFNAQVLSFSTLPGDRQISSDISSLIDRMSNLIQDSVQGGKIGPYAMLLADIDKKLQELQDQRNALLYIRNHAMKHAARLIREAEKTTDEKRVIYHVLNEHNNQIQNVSESLNLRESLVKKVLEDLENAL